MKENITVTTIAKETDTALLHASKTIKIKIVPIKSCTDVIAVTCSIRWLSISMFMIIYRLGSNANVDRIQSYMLGFFLTFILFAGNIINTKGNNKNTCIDLCNLGSKVPNIAVYK